MPFHNMTGSLMEIDENVNTIGDLRQRGLIGSNSSVFVTSDPDTEIVDAHPIDPDTDYFVLDRLIEPSSLLASVLGNIRLDTLYQRSGCFQFSCGTNFLTKESLRSIVVELRKHGLIVRVSNAVRTQHFRSQLTPYKFDCCIECETCYSCNDDDFDMSPYEDTMEYRLDKDRPWKPCKSRLDIHTFPPGDEKMAEAFNRYCLRDANKYQFDITNSDGDIIRNVCKAESKDRKRITISRVGHRRLIPITREILEASMQVVDKNHEYYDKIQYQLGEMVTNLGTRH